jgi:zinc transport system substrate-binding protein
MTFMKRITLTIAIILLTLNMLGCQTQPKTTQIVATTAPVYEFTRSLCNGTDIQVAKLVTESVSCLHDYTLQVSQMKLIEASEQIVISGAGFENFLDFVSFQKQNIIDASQEIELLCHDAHPHDDSNQHTHSHDEDPHIWLSPKNAKIMAKNIYCDLVVKYPCHEEQFTKNYQELDAKFDALIAYAATELESVPHKEIITFHDGFAYMAADFGLEIVHAIEEESGSEASAAELIFLTNIVTEHNLPAIFIECNGSTSAATIVSNETGVPVYALDMAMADRGYFEAMYYNIDTLKEALQ